MIEKLCIWIAWKLPRRLVYWAGIRMMSSATVGKYSDQIVPDLTIKQVIDRW